MAVTVDTRKTGLPYPAHLGTFTWATTPSASAYAAGTTFRASDVGISPGMVFVSDGTRWIPDGPQVLARSGVAVSHTGDTNETALSTVTIPAGAMGVNGGVQVYATHSFTNSVNNKIMRLRLNGIAGTMFFASTQTTQLTLSDMRRIRNRNSASSQVGSFASSNVVGLGQTTNAVATATINTAAAVDLVLSAQLASAGETITLENYEVWLTP